MHVTLRLISLPPDRAADRDPLVAALGDAAMALGAVRSAWVAPVSPEAVINAGHIVWRATFATEAAALAVKLDPAWRARVAPLLDGLEVTSVSYRPARTAVRGEGPGVWRALIFRVMPHGFPAEAAALEADLLRMPGHIRAIRGWALSPVSAVEGPKAYTHVWEQEFDSLAGLTGDYMTHPIHWGVVDAWFDAEYPQYIVDPHLIQVVGDIDASLLERP